MGGEDDFGKPLHLGNACNLINWQDLGSEYQGIGWVRNFKLIPIIAGAPRLGGRTRFMPRYGTPFHRSLENCGWLCTSLRGEIFPQKTRSA